MKEGVARAFSVGFVVGGDLAQIVVHACAASEVVERVLALALCAEIRAVPVSQPYRRGVCVSGSGLLPLFEYFLERAAHSCPFHVFIRLIASTRRRQLRAQERDKV